ncbi:MAG: pilus assembly protein [Pseudomonadota bacterium]|nr:pilus assembly protein [Pseudomonadota bacterium]
MMKRQNGIYTVEFAIIGVVFFLVLFGVIEIARALFVWNTIGEVTRRGARVAAVCPVDDSAIKEIAVFNGSNGDGRSPVLNGLMTSHVIVTYPPADLVATDGYVRVEVSNYTHQLIIPFLPASVTNLTVPAFSTTLPAESLGRNPDTGVYECIAT